MKNFVITSCMMIVALTITAQQLYQTQKGIVALTGRFKGNKKQT